MQAHVYHARCLASPQVCRVASGKFPLPSTLPKSVACVDGLGNCGGGGSPLNLERLIVSDVHSHPPPMRRHTGLNGEK